MVMEKLVEELEQMQSVSKERKEFLQWCFLMEYDIAVLREIEIPYIEGLNLAQILEGAFNGKYAIKKAKEAGLLTSFKAGVSDQLPKNELGAGSASTK
jgi:hypothetical protein